MAIQKPLYFFFITGDNNAYFNGILHSPSRVICVESSCSSRVIVSFESLNGPSIV